MYAVETNYLPGEAGYPEGNLMEAADVRFGSKADVWVDEQNVRSAPLR
jgi:hypothetical protein